MRIPPVHFVWKKPRPFWSIFPAPLATVIAASVIDSPHGWYYAASLICGFVVLLSLIESLTSGRIEDNWGASRRKIIPCVSGSKSISGSPRSRALRLFL